MSRYFPLFLGILIGIGLLGSLIYFKLNPLPSEKLQLEQQPATNATASPLPDAALEPNTATTPNTSTSETTMSKSNLNPDLTTDANGLSKATVILNTSKGVIRYKFYPKDAPNTVKRISELINQGFYNGLTFHRVVPGFVIQGGDPLGNGTGGSGTKLKAEFNERHHVEGTVAMARASDPDSADSQFYISLGKHSHLDRSYTVFGQVIEGMDVIQKIQMGDKIASAVIE